MSNTITTAEMSIAALKMIRELPLHKISKRLKLLVPEDLDTLRNDVIQKIISSENTKESLHLQFNEATDITKSLFTENLEKVSEEIMSGYDVIQKIDKIFEKLSADEDKAASKRRRAEDEEIAKKLGMKH